MQRKLDKPFKSIEDQVQILNERGLLFLDQEADKKKLQDYGYYEIINGYKTHFLNNVENDEEGYQNHINFQHIFDLYNLDKKIRLDMRYSLDDFEQSFKQNLAYVISRDISEDQNEYTKKLHYNTGNSRRGKFQNDRDYLIKKCFNRTLKSNFNPYKYYRDKHDNIPPWIMVKNLTFGQTIYWFKLSKPNIRRNVISRMLRLNTNPAILNQINKQLKITELFGDLLSLYLDYRNLSSHGGRIYNHRSVNHRIRHYSPLIYNNPDILKESKADFRRGKLRSSVGTVFQTLRLFMNSDPYANLYARLVVDISDYLKKYPNEFEFLMDEMELHNTLIEYELKKSFSV